MGEPLPDDNNEAPAPPRPPRPPGSYYYDDRTGYEPYDPASDEDENGDERGETTERGSPPPRA